MKRRVWRETVRRPLLKAWYKAFDGFLSIGTGNARYYAAMGVPWGKIFLMPYTVDELLVLPGDHCLHLRDGDGHAALHEAHWRIAPAGGEENREDENGREHGGRFYPRPWTKATNWALRPFGLQESSPRRPAPLASGHRPRFRGGSDTDQIICR